ncbi:MAG TPA: 5-deoxy-glucuronate isomerase [Candidatus Nanopelagicaceae bacterium]
MILVTMDKCASFPRATSDLGRSMMRRFFPDDKFAFEKGMKSITPQMAGWKYSGLSIIQLQPNIPHFLTENVLANAEGALIPLDVTNVKVTVNDTVFTLKGRRGVFEGASDWIYCSPGSRIEITSTHAGEVAIATAVAQARFPSCYVDALNVVEIRGAGDATREVRGFMHPDNFSNADRLMAVELITPDGNTSSYPPHRHDGVGNCRIANEEIYYFRIGKLGLFHGDPEGFGFHRTYAGLEYEDPFDETVTIHDGDIYLVPRGYHGPSTALPGYPMYYLNVLAGENSPRSMDFCDDPNHAWIRQSWENLSPDPRVPWKVK